MSVKQDVDLRYIQVLTYPQDSALIASLSLEEMQCWYAGQDPREMVYLSVNNEFKRFWYKHYLKPLRIKRLWFKFKANFRSLFRFKIR